MGNGEYKLVPNPKYGFLEVKPTPSAEVITKYYADEFYSGEYKKFNNSDLKVQLEDKDFYDGKWNDIYENLKDLKKDGVSGADLLDIGCGWAQALLFFKKKGLNCYGLDPAKEAVDYGKKMKLNVVHSGVTEIDAFNGKKFDIITLFNVFEHLADPIEVLSKIKKILKSKGLLVIDVPNEFNLFQTAGRDANNLKDWWVAPPAHLNYFSAETLTKLLEGEGFKVKNAESSFPLEMFLLFGDNYVKDPKIGRICHKKRTSFEINLRKQGKSKELRKFYQALAKINLGRQITVFATKLD